MVSPVPLSPTQVNGSRRPEAEALDDGRAAAAALAVEEPFVDVVDVVVVSGPGATTTGGSGNTGSGAPGGGVAFAS